MPIDPLTTLTELLSRNRWVVHPPGPATLPAHPAHPPRGVAYVVATECLPPIGDPR